jgi:hypothetical protein
MNSVPILSNYWIVLHRHLSAGEPILTHNGTMLKVHIILCAYMIKQQTHIYKYVQSCMIKQQTHIYKYVQSYIMFRSRL